MSLGERFGLKTAAFASSAGPEFYIESEAQRRALAHLRHGLKQGEGIVIITGDDGIGKSTILRRIADETSNDRLRVLMLDAARIDQSRFSDAILGILEVDILADDDVDLIDILCDHREKGISYALYIDNAEALTDEGLEQVRQLSTRFHDGEALLQISLAGDTPMRSVLYRSNMDKLRQRIIASYHIPSLTAEQSIEYIGGRLHSAGATRDGMFSEAALDLIVAEGGGMPASINRLSSAAIAWADARNGERVTDKDVAAAVRGGHPHQQSSKASPADHQSIPTQTSIETPAADADLPPAPVVAPESVVASDPITRSKINGHDSASMASDNVRKISPSADEINDAIERMSDDTDVTSSTPAVAPAVTAGVTEASLQVAVARVADKPKPSARRGMSPHELMMGKPTLSRPAVPKPAPEVLTPQPSVEQAGLAASVQSVGFKLSPAPEPQGDVWDPAHPLDEDVVARLDQAPITPIPAGVPNSAVLGQYLAETRENLDRLRANLKTLREETERLDERRRAAREKISARIDNLGSRLDTLRGEG